MYEATPEKGIQHGSRSHNNQGSFPRHAYLNARNRDDGGRLDERLRTWVVVREFNMIHVNYQYILIQEPRRLAQTVRRESKKSFAY